MCDAWLNQEIGHLARIRSAWTAAFFLRIWKNYLIKQQNRPESLMSFGANGISAQSFKIFSTMALRLIALLISHRHYYPKIPLLPWKHGTEPVEHIFGWMRVILPNFTVLDARQMVTKIHAVVKSVTSGKLKFEGSEHVRAGMSSVFHSSFVCIRWITDQCDDAVRIQV